MSLLHQFLPRHEVRIAAQQNIRAASGHVGRDGHHPQPARLRDNLCLAELRIQHHVPHALALQNRAQPLALLNRYRAHQHRLLLLVQYGNVVGDSLVLFLLRPVNHIRILKPQQGLVRRNYYDLQLVNLLELRSLGFCRARHAAQFLVKPEVVLEGDRGQRLIFLADRHALLRLDRLVQSVAPAPPRHQSSGKGVHNDHLTVLHHVLHIAPIEGVRLDRSLHVMLQFPVLSVGDVANSQELLDRHPAIIGYTNRPLLFVNDVVAGKILVLTLFNLFAFYQVGNNLPRPRIFVRCLVRWPGDNQRRPGFVDQDRIHFVDDCVKMPPLHTIL